jgi:hypothetical protein
LYDQNKKRWLIFVIFGHEIYSFVFSSPCHDRSNFSRLLFLFPFFFSLLIICTILRFVFHVNSRFRQKKEKSCCLYFCFSTLFFSALFQHSFADNDDGNEKEKRKKKEKKNATEFQVLSFSNEWLTASLTAVEWWWGINVERTSWLIHKVNISRCSK